MDVRRKLGLKVQALRAARGWSQDEFAHQAGIHRTYVSGVERGVRNPTVTVLEKLAAALQVDLAELLRFGLNAVIVWPAQPWQRQAP